MKKNMTLLNFHKLKWNNSYLILLIFLFFQANPIIAQDFSEQEKEELLIVALDKKINSLEGYLQFISNKNLDNYDERTSQIKSILEQFAPEATIEVSSLSSDKIESKKAEDYFCHLRDLKYSNVHIEFITTSVGNLTKLDDSTYRADGYFLQVFIGDEYGDLTEKGIDFKVNYIRKNDGTTEIEIIFLAIKVLSTRELTNFIKD